LAADLDMLIQIANRMAPEHLCLQVARAEELVDRVQAGAVFVGPQTPVAWGDYRAGPNHTLPTTGTARFRGPLSVLDFMIPTSVVTANRQVLRIHGKGVRTLADQEGLAAHALSIQLRME
jgi:histidinol dehydrogenase